jgi:hypothetical protein
MCQLRHENAFGQRPLSGISCRSGCCGAITRGSGAAARPAELRLARAADGSSAGPQRGARVGPEYRDRPPGRMPGADQVDGRVAVGKAQYPLRLPQIQDRRMPEPPLRSDPRPAGLFPAAPAGCQRRQTGCPSVGGLGPEGWSPTWHLLPAAPAPAGTATAGRPPTESAWGTAEPDRPGRRQRPAGAGRILDRLPEIAALSC